MQNFFIFLTTFTIIFFGIDLIQKFTNHKSKWSRKATHILSGIVVVFFPEFLSTNFQIQSFSGIQVFWQH